MIHIIKQPEPPELTLLRETPIIVESENPQDEQTIAATYDDLKDETKKIVCQKLLEEQGYLCAYCMRTIDSARIEHQAPQGIYNGKNGFPDLQLSYENFLGVCVGYYKENIKEKHCESVRGSTDLTINPLDANTLEQLKYTQNGKIFSENEAINTDLDATLKLNLEIISKKRQNTWIGVNDGLGFKGKNITIIERQIAKYSTQKIDGKRYEYCGIVLYFLQKELKDLQKK